jgi:DNA polymerase-4
MPAATARRRLPDAIYITPDFTAYRSVSREVMDIVRANAETVEVVGLDEAYIDLTALFSPKATARRIAAEIREATGLTCSIGISESRLLAKITSELAKPAGLVVLSRAEALERFAGDSPGLIPGIGPKTVEKLRRLGIRTLAELQARDVQELCDAFGPRQGGWLSRRSRFEDQSPVTTARETKSQSVERTFDHDIADLERLVGVMREQAAELSRRLHRSGLRGRTIGIKVRLDDWTTVTRAHTVEEPTNDEEPIATAALELLRAYAPPRPVRLLGVRVASFEREPAAEAPQAEPQLDLGLDSAA